MLLLLACLVFLLMLQFFYLCLLGILYLELLHFLLRSHYFLLVEFLNNHNLLQYFLFLHQIFQVLLLDIILQLHTHYLILGLLNIFYISFLRYVVFYKNSVNVIMILIFKDFLIQYNFLLKLLHDMYLTFCTLLFWPLHLFLLYQFLQLL